MKRINVVLIAFCSIAFCFTFLNQGYSSGRRPDDREKSCREMRIEIQKLQAEIKGLVYQIEKCTYWLEAPTARAEAIRQELARLESINAEQSIGYRHLAALLPLVLDDIRRLELAIENYKAQIKAKEKAIEDLRKKRKSKGCKQRPVVDFDLPEGD